jgi:hypothetical protein
LDADVGAAEAVQVEGGGDLDGEAVVGGFEGDDVEAVEAVGDDGAWGDGGVVDSGDEVGDVECGEGLGGALAGEVAEVVGGGHAAPR